MVTDSQLVQFLKTVSVKAGFLDRLKIQYRPLICPFSDLINFLPKESFSVFDIGCGSGQFALLLAQFTSVTDIKGIEIDQQLVKNANQLLSTYRQRVNVDFSVFNGKDIPDSIGTADYIFMIDVLHHVPLARQEEFLNNVVSKMTSGSFLVLKDIDAKAPWVLFNKLHDILFAGEIGHEWSLNRALSWAQRCNLKLVDQRKRQMYVYPHYTVVIQK